MFYFLIFNSSVLKNEIHENKKIVLTFLYGSIAYIILHAILTTSEILIIKIFKNYFWIFLLLDVATIYYLNADNYQFAIPIEPRQHESIPIKLNTPSTSSANTNMHPPSTKPNITVDNTNNGISDSNGMSGSTPIKSILQGKQQNENVFPQTTSNLPDELYNLNINTAQAPTETKSATSSTPYIYYNEPAEQKKKGDINDIIRPLTEKAHSKEDFEKLYLMKKSEFDIPPQIPPAHQDGNIRNTNNGDNHKNNNNDNYDNISISANDFDINIDDI